MAMFHGYRLHFYKRHLASALGLLSAFYLGPALAQNTLQNTDPLQFQAGVVLRTDSNLFRLPGNANVKALTGASDASETITNSSLGASLHTKQSQQTIDLSASILNNDYQKFNYLSYTGANYSAAWGLNFGSDWNGRLSSTRSETQNSFTDYNNYTQRNVNTISSTNLDVDYTLAPSWHLTGGVFTTRNVNEQQLLSNSDTSSAGNNAGARYTPSSGNSMSVTVRSSNGSNYNLPAALNIDNTFYQQDNIFQVNLLADSGSTFTASLDPFTYSQPSASQRNYSGTNTTLQYNWLYSAHTTLGAGYQHTVSTYATANTNYSQTDTVTLSPVWQISAKTALRLQQQWSSIDYVQFSGVAGADRQDQINDTSISLFWTPNRFLSLSVALEDLSRSSNRPGLDFQTQLITLNAQLSY